MGGDVAELTDAVQDALAALDGKLFTGVPETATVIDADQRTVRRALEAGEIPGVRIGQRWRIPVAWLREQAAGR